jgi:hypothetical protein
MRTLFFEEWRAKVSLNSSRPLRAFLRAGTFYR